MDERDKKIDTLTFRSGGLNLSQKQKTKIKLKRVSNNLRGLG